MIIPHFKVRKIRRRKVKLARPESQRKKAARHNSNPGQFQYEAML